MAFFQPQAKSVAKHTVYPAQQPWIEKYRPKTIDDVSAQEHTVTVLRKALLSTNLPHMLFYGPPGTGKTSTILALARQLFGPDNFRNRVLELNASDERGISVVREKIKAFARQTPRAQTTDSDGKNEADSMTQDAQGALRRIMENYARITRFCLVCNYVTRLDIPFCDPHSTFGLPPLDPLSTSSRLTYIAAAEQVEISPEVVTSLIDSSNGDLRRSITYLQSASRLSSSADPPTPITPRDIQEIAGVVPTAVVNDVSRTLGLDVTSNMAVDTGTPTRKGFDAVQKKVKEVIREGYSAAQFLYQLHDLIILHQTLPARQKATCALVIS
ncbi:P-loop containing nucleoside triphosphate hydrolase protein [Pisolithus croceorrhizus]|nr:P-loop containing nucleoside triphosphate hydrolase protein [Pisolithus croceorrhizus]